MTHSHTRVWARLTCALATLTLSTVAVTACDDDPVDQGPVDVVDTSVDDDTQREDSMTDVTTADTDDAGDTDEGDAGDVSDDDMETDGEDTDVCVRGLCGALGVDPDCCDMPECAATDKDGTKPCDPMEPLLASNACVDPDGDGTSTCHQACATTDDCDPGALCDDSLGACIPGECTGFFGGVCPDGQTCTPAQNGAFLCPDPGTGVAGDPCTAHSDCGVGLLCDGEVCAAPECAPLSGTPACGAGEVCVGYRVDGEVVDVGECIAVCDPLARNATNDAYVDTCGVLDDGSTCAIFEARREDGSLAGECVEVTDARTAGPGDACDGASSATTCGTLDGGYAPLTCVSGTCRVICDPEDQATCLASAESCFPITLQFTDGSTFDPDWGLCETTCTPSWDPDAAGAGCAAGEYCWPDFDIADEGRCFPAETDTGRDGEACDVETRTGCDDLHLCFTTETDDQNNPTAAECGLLCDPSAAAGDAGSCADGPGGQQRTCLALQVDDGMGGGVDLPVGTCNDTCDLTNLAEAGCSNADDGSPRYCQHGVLFGIDGVDLCAGGPATPLELQGDCTAADLDEFSFCKDNGFCLKLDEGVACQEVCLPIDPQTNNVPECSNPTATCQGALNTMDFGLCLLP